MVSSSAKSLKAKAFNRDYKEHDFSEGGQQDNLNLDRAVTKHCTNLVQPLSDNQRKSLCHRVEEEVKVQIT